MLLQLQNVSGGYGKGDIVKCKLRSRRRRHSLSGRPQWLRKNHSVPSDNGVDPSFRRPYPHRRTGSFKAFPRELANRIAYIPQYHSPVFSYTVLDVVLMGRASHFSAFDSPKAVDRDAAFEALYKVNALELANKKYTSLSGGQRQLALIARAICQSAKILVMDEPSASLDYANQQLLMDVIKDLASRGYCIIMSTHSPEHPASAGTRVLMMKQGSVAAFGSPEEVITPENLQAVYGIEMDVVTVKTGMDVPEPSVCP